MHNRLVILDRDGVINHDSDTFVKSPDEWQPIEGSVEAISRLNAAGFTVAVATNQSGIGRGLFNQRTLNLIHQKMRGLVRDAGGDVDQIVSCPHLPGEGCACRKPSPGLYLELAAHYGMKVENVPVIGDSLRDIQAAIEVSARPILVLTGNGMDTAASLDAAGQEIETFADLADASAALIAENGLVQ